MMNNQLKFFQQTAQVLKAFIHVTDVKTGRLLWCNKSPKEVNHNKLLTTEDLRKVALDKGAFVVNGTVEKVSEVYQIGSEYFYETVTKMQQTNNQVVGITVCLSEEIQTQKALSFLMKKIKKESTEAPTVKLTKKEIEVLQLVAQGYSSAEVAEKLNKKTNTVNTQRKNILKKLACRNTAELVLKTLELGII